MSLIEDSRALLRDRWVADNNGVVEPFMLAFLSIKVSAYRGQGDNDDIEEDKGNELRSGERAGKQGG